MGPHSRVPDARLLRARHLSEHWEETRAVHRYEDPPTMSYASFLHDLGGMDAVQQDRHFAVKPRLAAVYSLLQTGAHLTTTSYAGSEKAEKSAAVTPEQRDRGLIKALVLADAPAQYIADMMSYPTQTIHLFEHLAWDVRSRLKARGWLHNHVFAGGLYQETAMSDYEGMCVHAAYTGGLAAVERLLGLTPLESAEEIEIFRAQFAQELSRKAVVAMRTLPLNSHSSPEVMTGFVQWHKNAQDGDRKDRELKGKGGAGTGDLPERLAATLKEPIFTVAKTTVEYQGPPEETRCNLEFQRALDEVVAEAKLEVAR